MREERQQTHGKHRRDATQHGVRLCAALAEPRLQHERAVPHPVVVRHVDRGAAVAHLDLGTVAQLRGERLEDEIREELLVDALRYVFVDIYEYTSAMAELLMHA